MADLKVYAASWCPHCRNTIDLLREKGLKFDYIDMDTATPEVERQLDDVNGGEWVIPTLRFREQWRPGKAFNRAELIHDLRAWGIMVDE